MASSFYEEKYIKKAQKTFLSPTKLKKKKEKKKDRERMEEEKRVF